MKKHSECAQHIWVCMLVEASLIRLITQSVISLIKFEELVAKDSANECELSLFSIPIGIVLAAVAGTSFKRPLDVWFYIRKTSIGNVKASLIRLITQSVISLIKFEELVAKDSANECELSLFSIPIGIVLAAVAGTSFKRPLDVWFYIRKTSIGNVKASLKRLITRSVISLIQLNDF